LFKSNLWVLAPAILLGMSVAANASSCADPSTPVQISTGFVCTLGDLTFTFTSVAVLPPGTDYLIDPATGISGNDVILDIDVVSPGLIAPPFVADTNLTYTVTSTSADIAGIDNSFPNSNLGFISEFACDSAIVNKVCTGNTLATLNNTTPGVTDTAMFTGGPVNSISIYKDAEGNFSSFTDSIVETPEPASLGLMLVAGLGLAGLVRKYRQA
jgi:hypothetical protein